MEYTIIVWEILAYPCFVVSGDRGLWIKISEFEFESDCYG
jgi:hypothetical protein